MERYLYLDCSSGLSGDMAVASLLDLGADEAVLRHALGSLHTEGFEIRISRVMKSGIECCDFDVVLEKDNHDHDMEYLYGHENKESCHCHDHEEEHGHHHDHDHEGAHSHHHHHDHEHRSYADVKQIIDSGDLTENARMLAHQIFRYIADAESKAHAVPVEEVCFHEVGAVDSIVDVISFAVCYDNLGIQKTFIPYLVDGTGTVRCQHGIIPVPVPAVSSILAASSLPVRIMNVQGELLTPTGAAIAAAVSCGEKQLNQFLIRAIGYGAGKRETGLAGMVRAMLVETEEVSERIFKLETNVDDSTGEQLGFLMGELFQAGARDVHWIPCYMKKNRPGTILTVIAREKDIPAMEALIFRNTTTLGIRRYPVATSFLERKVREVETLFGKALVKECIADGNLRYYPEYESVAEIARKEGIGYMDAWEAIVDACQE